MSNIQIINYHSCYYAAVSQLWKKLGLGGSHRGDDENVIARTLKSGGAFFLMFDNDFIIGTSWITNDQRRLYLHHMGIHEKYQNQGLGLQLLQHSINWAQEQKLQLKLEVHPDNHSAVYLYKKAGFKKLGDYDVFIIRDYEQLTKTNSKKTNNRL